jgi:hypothetical protein
VPNFIRITDGDKIVASKLCLYRTDPKLFPDPGEGIAKLDLSMKMAISVLQVYLF